MKKTKNRCPDCKKIMIRHKRMKDFWWGCSSSPRCSVNALDYKGNPHYIKKEQILQIDFLNQLTFVGWITKDLRVHILIRLIHNRGRLSALPEKHISMYYRLVEPLRASIAFTKCCRCNYTLDAAESLNLGEDRYLCDYCWSH